MARARTRSHYDTLRVARDASADDVRRAYRRLAQKYHPDRHASGAAAADRMATINLAYEVLGDAQSRARYDADLADADAHGARGRARIAAIDVPTLSRASWLLLFVIAAFSMTTLAVVMLYTAAPRAPQPAPHAVSSVPVTANNTPLAPVPPIEPWKEPAPSVQAAADDPVKRLVRDGVIAPAARTGTP